MCAFAKAANARHVKCWCQPYLWREKICLFFVTSGFWSLFWAKVAEQERNSSLKISEAWKCWKTTMKHQWNTRNAKSHALQEMSRRRSARFFDCLHLLKWHREFLIFGNRPERQQETFGILSGVDLSEHNCNRQRFTKWASGKSFSKATQPGRYEWVRMGWGFDVEKKKSAFFLRSVWYCQALSSDPWHWNAG